MMLFMEFYMTIIINDKIIIWGKFISTYSFSIFLSCFKLSHYLFNIINENLPRLIMVFINLI